MGTIYPQELLFAQKVSKGNFGPAKILVRGTKIPGKSVPPDQNILKNLVRIRKKGSGLDFARARPISQCDSVEFYVEVCGEYEKTRKTMPVS